MVRKQTGINIFDCLSDEEYRLARHNAKKRWNSLPKEQRIELLSTQHEIVREKIKRHGGMITHKQALREYFNSDYIKQMEEAAKILEQNGYLAASRELRRDGRGVIAAVVDTPHLKALIESLDMQIEEMEK